MTTKQPSPSSYTHKLFLFYYYLLLIVETLNKAFFFNNLMEPEAYSGICSEGRGPGGGSWIFEVFFLPFSTSPPPGHLNTPIDGAQMNLIVWGNSMKQSCVIYVVYFECLSSHVFQEVNLLLWRLYSKTVRITEKKITKSSLNNIVNVKWPNILYYLFFLWNFKWESRALFTSDQ